MKHQYNVNGMHCAGCAARVEKATQAVPGVKKASVNLLAHCMTVDFGGGDGDDAAIINAVDGLGFKCTLMQNMTSPPTSEASEIRRRLLPSLVLWCVIFALMLWRMLHGVSGTLLPYYGLMELLLSALIIYINRCIFTRGFAHAFRSPDMDTLVALASTASFLLSCHTLLMLFLREGYKPHFYFESSAMILVIVTFGKYLESKAKGRAGAALDKLRELAPDHVTVFKDGTEHEQATADVRPGDIIVVKPGGRIPLDGVVTQGESSIDESPLTGESMPRDIAPDAKVFAGSMNLTGAFRFKATGVGQDTLLAGIIRLVSETALKKSGAVRLADAIAARFVPIVVTAAIITIVVWLLRGSGAEAACSYGISVLVVSCPCALGLATPVAVTVAMAKAAHAGILFKSGEAIERLRGVTTIYLDKTGTVTAGRPGVSHILPASGITENELLSAAASLEASSEHPIAKAILDEADKRALAFKHADAFKSETGRGISGTADGIVLLLGTRTFLEASGVTALNDTLNAEAAQFAQHGETVLWAARDGKCIGLISVQDTILPDSGAAIDAMKAMGLSLVMLSGDNPRTADSVAATLGITAKGGLLPADKEAAIREAQQSGQHVAMVGDGINDAPALTAADCGIAVGAGTDIAIECADIVVMGRGLAPVARAVRLARRAIRNIRENLFWAFCYNVLMIPIAAGCLASAGIVMNPMLCAAAMSMSSICVVSNALRLTRD